MITRTEARWQTTDWQHEMKNMIRSLDELCRFVDIEPAQLDISEEAARTFPLRVPKPYAARMEKGNVRDPLLLQVLPQAAEMTETAGFVSDPLEESGFNPVPGLVHKYHGRVLLITSPACAVHCRYCFRRHFPYQANTPGLGEWQQALDYIGADPAIHEVILSGGDPLSASDAYLAQLVERLAAIGHLHYLRVHTRLPVVIPQRVTADLLSALGGTRLKPVVVLHINHASELSGDVASAVQQLLEAGIRVLNQTVLLAGVNDTVKAQRELLEKLHRHDIQAYYLHLLDPVAGAAHYHVDEKQALALFDHLRRHLPGFMLPHLVREKPGAPYKNWLY